MITVHSLSEDKELHFDDNTVLEYAVVYSYLQDKPAEWAKFLEDAHNNTIDYSNYPLVYGQYSIGCGDYAVLKS
jgi:hypothetical protein